MNRILALWLASAGALLCLAQEPPLLTNAQVIERFREAGNLMESTSLIVPDLNRAAVPLVANVRATVNAMRSAFSPRHAGLTYTVLTNVRAYLALADAMPRPDPFPPEAARQLLALRTLADRMETHFRALLEERERLLRNPDRDNVQKYTEANSTVKAPRPGHPRVVFLGDSITEGWRLNEYFPDQDFINRGISGQVTGEMLGRMRADVINLKPAALVVLGGTNDLARGVPLNVIQDNLSMIADLAQAHGIKIILASLLPVSDYHKEKDPGFERTQLRRPDLIRLLNDWIRQTCERKNFTFLDYYPSVVDSAGYLREDASDDGLHPNSTGYRLMAPVAAKAVERAVGPGAAPPPPKPAKKRLGLF